MNIIEKQCDVCHAPHDISFSDDNCLEEEKITKNCLHQDCDGVIYSGIAKHHIETITLSDISSDADLYNEDGDEIEAIDIVTRQEQGY